MSYLLLTFFRIPILYFYLRLIDAFELVDDNNDYIFNILSKIGNNRKDYVGKTY